jgi:hypothetical protein
MKTIIGLPKTLRKVISFQDWVYFTKVHTQIEKVERNGEKKFKYFR